MVEKIVNTFLNQTTESGIEYKELSFVQQKKTSLTDREGHNSVDISSEPDYYAEIKNEIENKNESAVLCVYVSPQFSSMNYEEMLIKIMVNDLLLTHAKAEHQSKRVYNYIFTLDHTDPIYVDFNTCPKQEMVASINKILCKWYHDYNAKFLSYAVKTRNTFEEIRKMNQKDVRNQLNNKIGSNEPFPYYISHFYEDCDVPKASDLEELDLKIKKIIDRLF